MERFYLLVRISGSVLVFFGFAGWWIGMALEWPRPILDVCVAISSVGLLCLALARLWSFRVAVGVVIGIVGLVALVLVGVDVIGPW